MPPLPDGRVVVIVPAFNEAGTVAQVVTELVDHGLVAVVVDDGSSDQTAHVAEQAGARVLSLPFNLGVGGALRCGFRWAVDHGFDVVVQCDADGQHRVDQIKLLLEAQQVAGAHLVVGSRFAHDPSWDVTRARRVMMKVLARTASRAARTPISDATSGFRCIAEPLLSVFARSYPAQYLGDTFEALVAVGRAGYTVIEVPAELETRKLGRSSASTGAALRYLMRAVIVTALRLEVRVTPLRDAKRR